MSFVRVRDILLIQQDIRKILYSVLGLCLTPIQDAKLGRKTPERNKDHRRTSVTFDCDMQQ